MTQHYYLWGNQSAETDKDSVGSDYSCVFVYTLSIILTRVDCARAKLQIPSEGTMEHF